MNTLRLSYSNTTLSIPSFWLDVLTYTLENRIVTVCDDAGDDYRFGFNTQEKVDEISGKGNHNTALFWEYDTRLGRRWNVDPVVKEYESPYACFSNNPIWFSDINGDDAGGGDVSVSSTMSKNDKLTVNASQSSTATTSSYNAEDKTFTVTETQTTESQKATIYSSPEAKTKMDAMVTRSSITTTTVYNSIGQVVSKVKSDPVITSVSNSDVTSALNKSVTYLENYRNTNGRQFNRAVHEESKKIGVALKGGLAPFVFAGKGTSIKVGALSLSPTDIDSWLRGGLIKEHGTLKLNPVIYDQTKSSSLEGKAYRNEPSENVKKAQQLLYDFTFGILEKAL